MTESVKVKVRPGHSLQFPAICVHCSKPGTERMALRHHHDGITRLIDVPLCADCYRELQRQSHEEERLQKLGWLASGAVAVIGLVLLLILLPGSFPFWLRLLLGLVAGGISAAGTHGIFGRRRQAAARPEKRAILQSAAITDFSWRVTTFTFENSRFAARFAELNDNLLMDS